MLVSRIGHPITQPQIAQVRIRTRDGVPVRIDEIVREQLDALPSLQRELVDGTLAVDRWPFRA
jgi:S-adenosylmethionine synthetase